MKDTKYKKGLFSAVAVVLVLLFAVAANVLISGKDYSIDVTKNKLYTLSAQTEKILNNLEQPVTIYVLNGESKVNASYKKIFKEYKKASSNIKLSYKDPELYPDFAGKYVDDPDNVRADSVIVASGEKNRYISSDEYISYDYSSGYMASADTLQVEKLLTEAVNYVVSDKTPVVYALSGHAEAELSSDMVSSFQGDNYEVKTLNLLTKGSVPEDCAILLINGAQKDIRAEEREQIRTYMENGGKMYVFLDASVNDLPELYALLETYQVGVEKGVVVETDSSKYTQYPIYLLPTIENTEVTAAQADKNIFVLAPSAKGLKNLSQTENGEVKDTPYTVTSLLTTSDDAYAKVDTDSSTMEKEKKDIDGPFSLAMAVSDENGGRLIVTGCSNMLETSIDYAVGGANTDFVLNGMNYLSQQKSKISIRAKSLKADTAIVPAFGQKMMLLLTVFVLPALLLLSGIVMVIRRKRR